ALAGLKGGARQIECTINGLGERAGNTALEEVVMAMKTRGDYLGFESHIDTTQIYRSSQTVYNIVGQKPPMTKPIVGRNAFMHGAGIHQHGMLANQETYQIMKPESVGIRDNALVLGKHSGRHAFEEYLKELGYRLAPELVQMCFEQFKELCDRKKEVNDSDLRAIVTHNKVTQAVTSNEDFELVRFVVYTSNFTSATSTVCLKKGKEKMEAVSLGDGPVDAAFKAVDQIIKPKAHTFDIYTINSISEGKDTLGDVMVKLHSQSRSYTGRGLSTDIIEASILAYLSALNQMVSTEE
ncbi:MAG: 2-isopropylmalate synthase, partial [Lentisphaeria bacterium]|nr:2-isopropylmalate synthase [Lentisphaeria bacterium]